MYRTVLARNERNALYRTAEDTEDECSSSAREETYNCCLTGSPGDASVHVCSWAITFVFGSVRLKKN